MISTIRLSSSQLDNVLEKAVLYLGVGVVGVYHAPLYSFEGQQERGVIEGLKTEGWVIINGLNKKEK